MFLFNTIKFDKNDLILFFFYWNDKNGKDSKILIFVSGKPAYISISRRRKSTRVSKRD